LDVRLREKKIKQQTCFTDSSSLIIRTSELQLQNSA
jgi:hypothetical protein